MPIITWSSNLSVNVAEMDRQHRKLIDMINELFDAMSSGKGKDTIGKILDGLTEYTKTHFASEERMMQLHNYPELSTQQSEHIKLTKQVTDLHERFKSASGSLSITLETMNFLKDWLQNHILQNDKKYGPYLNCRGVN
ncbi:MAG: hemerythrin family protein [Deltaproteobacteria bacterium]|nr:hemerythrin family protein [Deltaproteobacteria bacterium]